MEKIIKQFLSEVNKRNQNEPEFMQAVTEVAETVIPYIVTKKIYYGQNILLRMVEPERVVSFRVAWIDDNEEIISNAIERNYERWDDFIGEYIWIEPEPVPETYDEEISTMKNWISNRLVWMDMEMPGDCNNTNFEEANIYDNKNIFMIVDLLGRPAYNTKNQALIYIYNDGKVQKKFIK